MAQASSHTRLCVQASVIHHQGFGTMGTGGLSCGNGKDVEASCTGDALPDLAVRAQRLMHLPRCTPAAQSALRYAHACARLPALIIRTRIVGARRKALFTVACVAHRAGLRQPCARKLCTKGLQPAHSGSACLHCTLSTIKTAVRWHLVHTRVALCPLRVCLLALHTQRR